MLNGQPSLVTTSGTLANTGSVSRPIGPITFPPGTDITASATPRLGGFIVVGNAPPPGNAPVIAPALPPVAPKAQASAVAPVLTAVPAGRSPAAVRGVPSAAVGGVVTATVERLTIGGAPALTVDLAGDGLLRLQLGRPVVDIQGRPLTPDSSSVALSGGTARDVVSAVTNNRGLVPVRSVTREGGVIVFGSAPAN